jgi:F-box domain
MRFETIICSIIVAFAMMEILFFQMLHMIFNRINFHGHLRLSGVCKRWLNLVQNDVVFMKTVEFQAWRVNETHQLMRTYPRILLFDRLDITNPDYQRNFTYVQGFRTLLKNAEIINFGPTNRYALQYVMPLCENAKDITLYLLESPSFNNTALTFEHPLPIKISHVTYGPNKSILSDVLDRFKVITDISPLVLCSHDLDASEEFVAKYGALSKSLEYLISSDRPFNGLDRFDNLKLQSLTIMKERDSDFQADPVDPFFAKQAPFLETIIFRREIIDAAMFDSMRLLLGNLETVRLSCSSSQQLCLNDLKVLTKLKCLDLEVRNVNRCRYYVLDIPDLVTLTELRMCASMGGKPILRIRSRKKPLVALEKFRIFGFGLDLVALEHVVQAMPGLKKLKLIYYLYSVRIMLLRNLNFLEFFKFFCFHLSGNT